jgi:hypothetical protein
LSFFPPERDAVKRQRGFYILNRIPLPILAINGQKATKKIIPDPKQSTIINGLRVSEYFR